VGIIPEKIRRPFIFFIIFKNLRKVKDSAVLILKKLKVLISDFFTLAAHLCSTCNRRESSPSVHGGINQKAATAINLSQEDFLAQAITYMYFTYLHAYRLR
jgi:hypothetical protein